MKRSKFLAAIAAMFTVPFLSFGKKEHAIPQKRTLIIRESTMLNWDRPETHERQRRDAMDRLLRNVEEQVQEWETGAILPGKKPRRDLHLMTEVVILRVDQKEKLDSLNKKLLE